MIYFFINLIICIALYILMEKINIKESIKKTSLLKITMILCLFVYMVSVFTVFGLLGNLFTSLSLSLIPGSVPYIIYDIYNNYIKEKEQKQLTAMLMILSKWSSVRNDLVFCLQKLSSSNIKKPISSVIGNANIRIQRGMDCVKAVSLMEQDAKGENFRYIVRNIRVSALKGGNLSELFKDLEDQFFKISEEMYKRKISTYRDKVMVYVTMGMVWWTGIYIISSNSSAYEFYLYTRTGNMLMGVLGLLFFLSSMIYLKK